jgi:hypothetical protein
MIAIALRKGRQFADEVVYLSAVSGTRTGAGPFANDAAELRNHTRFELNVLCPAKSANSSFVVQLTLRQPDMFNDSRKNRTVFNPQT